MRKENMGEPITQNRRVLKIGGSYYISLPTEFVILHNIKRGEKVPTTANHLFKVIPQSER